MTQQINLLDPALLPAHDWCNGRFIVGLGAVLALATLGQWHYEKRALAALVAASTPEEEPEVSTATIDAEIAALTAQLAGGQALLQVAGGLTELPHDSAARVRSLISAMPQNLWLDEVEFGVNKRVRISGGVGDAAGLATFSQRLGTSTAYSGLPLRVVALEPNDGEAPQRPESTVALTAPPMNSAFRFVLASTDGIESTPGALR